MVTSKKETSFRVSFFLLEEAVAGDHEGADGRPLRGVLQLGILHDVGSLRGKT
jgi:hypothetical protein